MRPHHTAGQGSLRPTGACSAALRTARPLVSRTRLF